MKACAIRVGFESPTRCRAHRSGTSGPAREAAAAVVHKIRIISNIFFKANADGAYKNVYTQPVAGVKGFGNKDPVVRAHHSGTQGPAWEAAAAVVLNYKNSTFSRPFLRNPRLLGRACLTFFR